MPQIKVIQLFSNIFGVGPKTARNWYNLGLRTLDDLRSGKGGVTLDRRQKLGLKYFDDLIVKIPRSEVQEIEQFVRGEVEALCKGSTMMICGSYRRSYALSFCVSMCHDASMLSVVRFRYQFQPLFFTVTCTL